MGRFVRRGNGIESEAGSIRMTGRAGLAVTFGGQEYDVHSEMLAPPMSIVLYTSSGALADAAAGPGLLAFVREGLEDAGFAVEVM